MVIKKRMYECPKCTELHNNKEGAKDCCEVDEVEAWVCDDCGAPYDFKDEAESCCNGSIIRAVEKIMVAAEHPEQIKLDAWR